MRRYLILIIVILLLNAISFGQTKIIAVGKYIGYDMCAISTMTISINKSHKFKTNYTGHYFTNKTDKGKWKIISDTLILLRKKEDWYKFIILDNKLCAVKEDSTSCKFCIIKQ